MPRPRKRRRLMHRPQSVIFNPIGSPLRPASNIVVLPEEFEALRLVDMEGLYQEDAAKQMGISRSALQRTVAEARYKVAKALLKQVGLQINGTSLDHIQGK